MEMVRGGEERQKLRKGWPDKRRSGESDGGGRYKSMVQTSLPILRCLPRKSTYESTLAVLVVRDSARRNAIGGHSTETARAGPISAATAVLEYGKRRKAFPHTLWPTIYYFGYRGSITAPPCADIVNWCILDTPIEDTPIEISKRQYQQLTRLIDSYRGESSCGEQGQTASE